MNYDEQYAAVDDLFGTEAEPTLKRFAGRLKPGSEVLDIGAGQGRNGVFLAERGFTVHALEPGQIVTLFKGHSTLHCREGLGPAHRHGDGPPERHGKFEAVLSKQAKPCP